MRSEAGSPPSLKLGPPRPAAPSDARRGSGHPPLSRPQAPRFTFVQFLSQPPATAILPPPVPRPPPRSREAAVGRAGPREPQQTWRQRRRQRAAAAARGGGGE